MKKTCLLFVFILVFCSFGVIVYAENNSGYIKVYEATQCTYALSNDGKIYAWGDIAFPEVTTWTDIIDFSIGQWHALGLKSDGTVVATGSTHITSLALDVGEWKNIIKVCAGGVHSIGLVSDGTVVATGDYRKGATDVEDWKNIVDIATLKDDILYAHTFALTKDGKILHTGSDLGNMEACLDWSDITSIEIGTGHIVGLKSDGTVVATGYDDNFECNVRKWKDIERIFAGNSSTFGQKKDGTWVYTGNAPGLYELSDWSQVISVSNSNWDSVVLLNDGSIIGFGYNVAGELDIQNSTGNNNDQPKLKTQKECETIALDYMKNEMNKYLKNPDSLTINKVTSSVIGDNVLVIIDYSAMNGFGGYNRENYYCEVDRKTGTVNFGGSV